MSDFISQLDLGARATGALRQLGVKSIEDLFAVREADVLVLRNAASKTWSEICEAQMRFALPRQEPVAPWSKRDEIALHMMPSLMEHHDFDFDQEIDLETQLVTIAYRIADTMLRVRQNPTEETETPT